LEAFAKPDPEASPTQRRTSLLDVTIKAKSGYVNIFLIKLSLKSHK